MNECRALGGTKDHPNGRKWVQSRPENAPLRQRLRELAAERRQFGYCRVGYLLAPAAIAPSYKKLLRIYREEGCGFGALAAASAP